MASTSPTKPFLFSSQVCLIVVPSYYPAAPLTNQCFEQEGSCGAERSSCDEISWQFALLFPILQAFNLLDKLKRAALSINQRFKLSLCDDFSNRVLGGR